MRKTTSLTLAVVLTTAIAVTATAAPKKQTPQPRRERIDVVETVKKWVKRVYEVTTVPNPDKP